MGLFHEGVLDAVRLATKLEKSAVMHDAVDGSSGHVVVTEHRSPAGGPEVGGDDQASFLRAIRDAVEREPGALGIDLQIAEFVDCEEPIFR